MQPDRRADAAARGRQPAGRPLTRSGPARPGRRRRCSAAVRRRFGGEPRVEAGTLEAARAALARPAEAPLVVVVGGDGTVREAAEPRSSAAATPLAVVPGRDRQRARAVAAASAGSGRRSRRSATAARACIDLGRGALDDGRRRRLAGTTHERLFAVACGMGLDARIMAAAEHEWKRRMRFGAYVGAAVRELLGLETARFRIVADGETLEIDGLPGRSSPTPASWSRDGSDRASRSTRPTACSTSSSSAAANPRRPCTAPPS